MINILYKKITSDIDVSNIPENEVNRIEKYGSKKRISWFPSAHYIRMVEDVTHEYAGMWWTAAGGR